MKKLLLLLIPIAMLGIIVIGFRYIAATKPNPAALQVTATPQAEVFLDGSSLGKTPLYNDTLPPGEHLLKLVPQDSSGLFNFEEKLTFRSGILTVVDRIFKATEAESEVGIISLEAASTKNATEVAVVSSPDGAEVKVDEEPQGITPLLLKETTASDHQVTISKEGYNSKTLRVRPAEGYRLTISAKLSILQTNTSADESQKVSTSSAGLGGKTTVPNATGSATIRIRQTPTGFLRVRASPTTASKEIAKVSPDETYELVEEKEGWFKIKLVDEQEGWVSSQYAEKE